MGVYTRTDSKYYWLWLRTKHGKGIKERTNVLAVPEHRDVAEKVYRERSKQLAITSHFSPHRLKSGRADAAGWTYIYFVTDGQLLKIGRAVNVLARLRAMQTSHPDRLTVLATLLGHSSIEGVIQQQFRHLRVRREWFKLDHELLAFIDRIKKGRDVIPELVAPFTVRSRAVRRSQKSLSK